MRKRDPKTPAEWQEAVNHAAGWRMVYDCMAYGLIQGGPEINAERCDYICRNGAKLGYHPSLPVVDLAVTLIRAYNLERIPDTASKPATGESSELLGNSQVKPLEKKEGSTDG